MVEINILCTPFCFNDGKNLLISFGITLESPRYYLCITLGFFQGISMDKYYG